MIAFFEMLNNKLDSIAPVKKGRPSLAELTGKVCIDLDELAEVSGMSKTVIEKAVRNAEADKTLHRYPGRRGKAVYRCEELETVIDNLPAIEKPARPGKAKPAKS